MPYYPEAQEEVPEVILSCGGILRPEDQEVSDDEHGVDEEYVGSGDGWPQDNVQITEGSKERSE